MRDAPLSIRWVLFEHRLQHFGGWREPWWSRPVRWLGWSIYKTRRYLQGARSITCSKYDGTCGSVDDDGIDIQFSGACPVQGEGTVDGREVYYRSRGEGWQFHVAAPGSEDALGDEAWEYTEHPYFFPDGGWVDASVSRACIRKAVAKWREAGRP